MRWASLVVVAALLAGCAQPRVITSITGAEDQMKFIYAKNASLFSAAETGLIQCGVQPDGTLYRCRKIPITFQE